MPDSGTVSMRRRWFASSGFGMLALGAALALGFAQASQSVSRALGIAADYESDAQVRQAIAQSADTYAFFFDRLGLPPPGTR